MKQIEEASRKTPIMAETDVLVVGSGPGGLAAALAAAREGVDTMLVERYGCFGGNITQAMVASIAWYRYEKTVEAGGIGIEFERRADQMGASQSADLIEYLDEDMRAYAADMIASLPNPPPASATLDADMFKVVADQMVQESGIIPLLHCLTVDVVMEGNTVKGVITESKS